MTPIPSQIRIHAIRVDPWLMPAGAGWLLYRPKVRILRWLHTSQSVQST